MIKYYDMIYIITNCFAQNFLENMDDWTSYEVSGSVKLQNGTRVKKRGFEAIRSFYKAIKGKCTNRC
jgi:hypothetical protein